LLQLPFPLPLLLRLQIIDLPPTLAELGRSLFRSANLSVLPLGSLPWLCGIGKFACRKNHNLHCVLIPDSVSKIYRAAFEGCVSLSEVGFVLPLNLVSTGAESFGGCNSLTQCWIVESVRELDGCFLAGWCRMSSSRRRILRSTRVETLFVSVNIVLG
jgi:hypothetical protein